MSSKSSNLHSGSRSAPTKRKILDTEIYYLIIFANGEHAVVSEKKITLSSRSTGVVRHYNRKYMVNILKSGSKYEMEKRSKRYSALKSIETGEETETLEINSKIQKVKPSNLPTSK